ncbi:DUF1285 domain-containing protein [Aliidiomarina soli]|uniref:DUF1285 domain-containing protein n=1 Tax=Aliidiomarina soli TaxID=1928574 RepID=A0A432WEI8_9GAMM|nr:DUF1285 domain-containing protein [Aliidiomarina soli]RUO31275.1 DUF1285 domain-containing protein [Aliidiomarina soli]
MVDLKTLQGSLSDYQRPPLEKWNPPFCGDIDICIKQDGRWFYQGSEITRNALVRLFASVLWKESDDYYLKTPAEKVRIEVEDLPFVVVDWQVGDTPQSAIEVSTNTGERYQLSESHPLILHNKQPAVQIRDGFLARVHRNVYYQWAELVTPAQKGEADGFYLQSGSCRFYFGPAS